MENCGSCDNPAVFVCSCQQVFLCGNCISAHMQAAPNEVHSMVPISQHQDAEDNRKKMARLAKMEPFADSEQENLDKIKQYREDLPAVFDKIELDFKAQLDNLFNHLDERAEQLETKIESNLSTWLTGDFQEEDEELLVVTEKLKYDLESSLDSVLDDFMGKMREQLSVEHKLLYPFQPDSRTYAWSNQLKHPSYQLTKRNRTITKKTGFRSWGQILIDRPMENGKHVWKVKLQKIAAMDYIGVCSHTERLDQPMNQTWTYDFYAFHFNEEAKLVSKTVTEAYGKVCKKGDVITVRVELKEGIGTLSFSVNDEDFGVAFEDLKPPLYPFANLGVANDKITIIN